MEPNTSTAQPTRISEIGLLTIFVDDYPAAVEFYTKILSLDEPMGMGPTAGFFELNGTLGMYIIGGRPRTDLDVHSCRTALAFRVPSVSAMQTRLKEAGATMLMDEPMQMNEETYWMQFRDPAGNILEVIGEK